MAAITSRQPDPGRGAARWKRFLLAVSSSKRASHGRAAHRSSFCGSRTRTCSGRSRASASDTQSLAQLGRAAAGQPRTAARSAEQLEADDLKLLFAVAGDMDRSLYRGHRIGRRPMIAAMAKSGLRVTQMCRLRWRDVDVHHERLVIDEAKTDAGNRHVDLSRCRRRHRTPSGARTSAS